MLFSLLVVRMDQDNPWLLAYVPLYVIGYNQFLEIVLVISLVKLFLVSEEYGWNSVQRKAQVKTAQTGD